MCLDPIEVHSSHHGERVEDAQQDWKDAREVGWIDQEDRNPCSGIKEMVRIPCENIKGMEQVKEEHVQILVIFKRNQEYIHLERKNWLIGIWKRVPVGHHAANKENAEQWITPWQKIEKVWS